MTTVEPEQLQPTHRHKKRGSEYVLIGIGKMQAENWRDPDVDADYDSQLVDMREVAIYRSVDDRSLWVRPREEYEDGRFEAIAPTGSPAPSTVEPTVTVKPLEWDEHMDGDEWFSMDDATGNGLGIYWISQDEINVGEYSLRIVGIRLDSYPTPEDAKAAAQAGFDARIRSR